MKRHRASNRGFRRTAVKTNQKNRWSPMRGGIRL